MGQYPSSVYDGYDQSVLESLVRERDLLPDGSKTYSRSMLIALLLAFDKGRENSFASPTVSAGVTPSNRSSIAQYGNPLGVGIPHHYRPVVANNGEVGILHGVGATGLAINGDSTDSTRISTVINIRQTNTREPSFERQRSTDRERSLDRNLRESSLDRNPREPSLDHDSNALLISSNSEAGPKGAQEASAQASAQASYSTTCNLSPCVQDTRVQDTRVRDSGQNNAENTGNNRLFEVRRDVRKPDAGLDMNGTPVDASKNPILSKTPIADRLVFSTPGTVGFAPHLVENQEIVQEESPDSSEQDEYQPTEVLRSLRNLDGDMGVDIGGTLAKLVLVMREDVAIRNPLPDEIGLTGRVHTNLEVSHRVCYHRRRKSSLVRSKCIEQASPSQASPTASTCRSKTGSSPQSDEHVMTGTDVIKAARARGLRSLSQELSFGEPIVEEKILEKEGVHNELRNQYVEQTLVQNQVARNPAQGQTEQQLNRDTQNVGNEHEQMNSAAVTVGDQQLMNQPSQARRPSRRKSEHSFEGEVTYDKYVLRFLSGNTAALEQVVSSLQNLQPFQNLQTRTIAVAGGGAHKYETLFREALNVQFEKHKEMKSLVEGLKFVLERPETFSFFIINEDGMQEEYRFDEFGYSQKPPKLSKESTTRSEPHRSETIPRQSETIKRTNSHGSVVGLDFGQDLGQVDSVIGGSPDSLKDTKTTILDGTATPEIFVPTSQSMPEFGKNVISSSPESEATRPQDANRPESPQHLLQPEQNLSTENHRLVQDGTHRLLEAQRRMSLQPTTLSGIQRNVDRTLLPGGSVPPSLERRPRSVFEEPVLLVIIGSGVSILHVKSNDFERVGGTGCGGGTFLGLAKLLCGVSNYEEALALAETGDASKIDTLVEDIYGKEGSHSLGLPGHLTASNFGKLGTIPGKICQSYLMKKKSAIGRSSSSGDMLKMSDLMRGSATTTTILNTSAINQKAASSGQKATSKRSNGMKLGIMKSTPTKIGKHGKNVPSAATLANTLSNTTSVTTSENNSMPNPGTGSETSMQSPSKIPIGSPPGQVSTKGSNPGNITRNSSKASSGRSSMSSRNLTPSFTQNDLARAVLQLVVQQVAVLARAFSESLNIQKIFFVGGFLEQNPIATKMMAASMRTLGKTAFFPKHCDFLGALGSLAYSLKLKGVVI